MPGLTFTNNGNQWILCPDGSVSGLKAGVEQPNQGSWSADLLANAVRLSVGTQNISVPVKYSFNKDNQLVVVVPGGGAASSSAAASASTIGAASAAGAVAGAVAGTSGAAASPAKPAAGAGAGTSGAAAAPATPAAGAVATKPADSAPYTFLGRIDISGNTVVRYTLLNPADSALNPVLNKAGAQIVFFIHGALSVSDALDQLVITYPDKSSTFITGSLPAGKSVHPDQNPHSSTDADRLTFYAATAIPVGNGASKRVQANIIFLGSWDLNQDGIAFKASGSGKDLSIQLGGTYKGVAAGIAVHRVGNDTDIAFFIHGSHAFKSPSGQNTDVNWSVGLGYSGKQFAATVVLGAKSTPANTGGNTFQLDGTMQFLSGPTNAFALDLKATYDTRSNGDLVFTANVSSGSSGLNYALGLEGKYIVKGGQVTFDISLNGGAGGNSAKVEFGYISSNGALEAHMEAVLQNNQVSFDFELSMHFVNGKLMPAGAPVALASPSSSGTQPSSTAAASPSAATAGKPT